MGNRALVGVLFLVAGVIHAAIGTGAIGRPLPVLRFAFLGLGVAGIVLAVVVWGGVARPGVQGRNEHFLRASVVVVLLLGAGVCLYLVAQGWATTPQARTGLSALTGLGFVAAGSGLTRDGSNLQRVAIVVLGGYVVAVVIPVLVWVVVTGGG
jgi:hypothetical protein